MYEELVKELRSTAEVNSLSLYKRGLMKQAVDAIEDLQKQRDEWESHATIAEIMATNPWIPVTERLPEDGEDVILTDGKNVSFGYSHNLFSGMEWYIPHGRVGKVTHWMPLPEPPKEEA